MKKSKRTKKPAGAGKPPAGIGKPIAGSGESRAEVDKPVAEMRKSIGGNATPTLPLAENIALIAFSAQSIANSADTILRAAGTPLTLADWALLQHIAKAPARSVGRLGAVMGVSRQRVQKQIDDIATLNLVEVQVTEDDKRSRIVTLTSLGHDTLRTMGTTWFAQLSRSNVTTTKLDGVRRRLEKLSGVLLKARRADLKAGKAAGSDVAAAKPE